MADPEAATDLYKLIENKNHKLKLPQTFSIMQRPVQLIRVREDRLEICEDGNRLLSKIKVAMKSVGVFGLTNSGKGLLLNLLTGKLGQKYKIVFERMTEGIWIWGSEQSESTVFIDCITLSEEHSVVNSRLIALMTMLSSVVVFNSLGPISLSDLRQLSLFNFMSNYSGLITNTHFIWLLRSFELNVYDEHGLITPHKYMQGILQAYSAAEGELGGDLHRLFASVACTALSRPTLDEELLVSYENLQESDLTPKFLAQVRSLKAEIESKLTKKLLFEVPMSGTMTAFMLSDLLDRINQDMPIEKQSVLHKLAIAKHRHLISKAEETYYSELDLDYESLPVSEVTLSGMLLKARMKSERILAEDEAFKAEAYDQLSVIAEVSERYWFTVNAELSDVYNQALAERLLKPILASVGEAITQDSYTHYIENWNHFIATYKQQARGVNRLRPVMRFLNENQTAAFNKHFSIELDKYSKQIQHATESKATMTRTKRDLEDNLQTSSQRLSSITFKVKLT
jgi:hypothetical protein